MEAKAVPVQQLEDIANDLTMRYRQWSEAHGWGGNIVPVYDNSGHKRFEARDAAPLPPPPTAEKIAAAEKVLRTAHDESLKQ